MRIFKKRPAPFGKYWIVITCKRYTKEGKETYRDGFAVLNNTPEERINDMAERMYQQIKLKFSL